MRRVLPKAPLFGEVVGRAHVHYLAVTEGPPMDGIRPPSIQHHRQCEQAPPSSVLRIQPTYTYTYTYGFPNLRPPACRQSPLPLALYKP